MILFHYPWIQVPGIFALLWEILQSWDTLLRVHLLDEGHRWERQVRCPCLAAAKSREPPHCNQTPSVEPWLCRGCPLPLPLSRAPAWSTGNPVQCTPAPTHSTSTVGVCAHVCWGGVWVCVCLGGWVCVCNGGVCGVWVLVSVDVCVGVCTCGGLCARACVCARSEERRVG